MPSFAWLDESIEHSDYDTTRATAIAHKITQMQDAEERRMFRYQSDAESGYDYDPYEDCDCEFCVSQNSLCEHPTTLTECSSRAEDARNVALAQAEQDLEIELLMDQLQLLGARMMRPYEHWNEDEQYMQYMESDRY